MSNILKALQEVYAPKQIAEVEEPKSPAEKNFKDKHVVTVKADAAGNSDDHFTGKNVGKDKSRRADYKDGEDEEVYESEDVTENVISKLRDLVDKKHEKRVMKIGGEFRDISLRQASKIVSLYDNQKDKKDQFIKALDNKKEFEKILNMIEETTNLDEAKMENSEVLAAAKKLAKNGKDAKTRSFGQGLVDFYDKNDSFTPEQVSGLQNIMKNAPFQMAEEKEKKKKDWEEVLLKVAAKNEDTEINERVEISQARFERVHGRKASGRGALWAFTSKKYGNVRYDNEEEVLRLSGMMNYSDAAKKAQEWARDQGHSVVYVMESIDEAKEATGALKDVCWKDYTAVGMKTKNGKKVPNCVPKNENVSEAYPMGQYGLPEEEYDDYEDDYNSSDEYELALTDALLLSIQAKLDYLIENTDSINPMYLNNMNTALFEIRNSLSYACNTYCDGQVSESVEEVDEEMNMIEEFIEESQLKAKQYMKTYLLKGNYYLGTYEDDRDASYEIIKKEVDVPDTDRTTKAYRSLGIVQTGSDTSLPNAKKKAMEMLSKIKD